MWILGGQKHLVHNANYGRENTYKRDGQVDRLLGSRSNRESGRDATETGVSLIPKVTVFMLLPVEHRHS